jgi:hypothetical protein
MYQMVREYYTASTPTCLFPLQQEEGVKMWGRGFPGAAAYGAYGVYTNAARFGGFGGAFGAYNYTGSALAGELGPAAGINNALAAANAWPPPLPPGTGYGGPGLGGPGSAHTGSYGSGAPQVAPLRSLGTKIFVGRLPLEATAEDLRRYFNNFGRISDVYVPKVGCHSSWKKLSSYQNLGDSFVDIAVCMVMIISGRKEDITQGFWLCYFC